MNTELFIPLWKGKENVLHAFSFPFQNHKQKQKHTLKFPGLNFKYTTKFQTLWGFLKMDIFFNPLINITWNIPSSWVSGVIFYWRDYLRILLLFKSQVGAEKACVWLNPRQGDPERDSQLN